jgi:hypothetical protein
MKFDFNKPVIGLDGKELLESGETAYLGKTLAVTLVAGSSKNSVKYFTWAQDLFQGKEVNLDKQDVKMLCDFIDENKTLTDLTKGQLLQILYSPAQ